MQNLTQDERVALTRAVIHLLDIWGAENSAQVKILCLPDDTPSRKINRYRDMGDALPDDPQVNLSIEHILGIADALRTTFPQNPQMGPLWMRRRNKHLRRRTPMSCMIEDGINGLIRVRTHLDCAFAWDRSGSVSA